MSDFDTTTKRLARAGRDEFERAMGTYLGLKLSTDELSHVYRMVQMVACEAASEGYLAGYNHAEGIVNKAVARITEDVERFDGFTGGFAEGSD